MAVIASVRQGLTLYLSDRGANVVAQPAVPNAPLYASWSADSHKLLVHGNSDHYLITVNGPEPLDNHHSPIDYDHYLERQLAPAADSILHFLDRDFARIVGDQLPLF